MTPCPTRTLPSAGKVPLATTVRLPPLRISSEPVSPAAAPSTTPPACCGTLELMNAMPPLLMRPASSTLTSGTVPPLQLLVVVQLLVPGFVQIVVNALGG